MAAAPLARRAPRSSSAAISALPRAYIARRLVEPGPDRAARAGDQRNDGDFGRAIRRTGVPLRGVNRLRHLLNGNTQDGQPAQHRLSLRSRQRLLSRSGSTRSMTYSSALFDAPATVAGRGAAGKARRRSSTCCSPAPTPRVLEIGCGWGALAAAPRARWVRDVTGADAVATSNWPTPASRAEAEGWRRPRRLAAPGLSRRDGTLRPDRLDRDARSGRRTLLADLFRQTARAADARRHGRAPGHHDRRGALRELPQAAPISSSATSFPAACCRRRAIIASQATHAGLDARSTTPFGSSYAATLAEWRQRFQAAWPEIERLGFPPSFRRLWEYYLCYCEAGFRTGLLDVAFYLFAG